MDLRCWRRRLIEVEKNMIALRTAVEAKIELEFQVASAAGQCESEGGWQSVDNQEGQR